MEVKEKKKKIKTRKGSYKYTRENRLQGDCKKKEKERKREVREEVVNGRNGNIERGGE